MSFVSKIGGGLGVISMGLTVIAAFLPVKSTEQKILDTVTEIKHELTNFETEMKTLWDRVVKHGWDQASRSNLETQYIAQIVQVSNTLNNIAQKRKRNEDYSNDESKPWTEQDSADIAADLAGDPTISTEPSAQITAISENIAKYTEDLTKKTTLESWIGNYASATAYGIDLELGSAKPKDGAYQAAANAVTEQLWTQYPWLNFTTLVFKSMDTLEQFGWQPFGESGGLASVTTPLKDGDGHAVRAVVYFTYRTRTEKPTT